VTPSSPAADSAAQTDRLTVTTRPIADPVELLGRLPITDPVAWVRNGEGLIGWGVAARLEVRGDERFSRTQRWWSNLCASFDVDDTVSMPGTGPVAFGSFSFDPKGTSVVVVPQVIVGRRAGQAWITVIGGDPRTAIPPVSVPEQPYWVTWSEGSQTSIEWQASVPSTCATCSCGWPTATRRAGRSASMTSSGRLPSSWSAAPAISSRAASWPAPCDVAVTTAQTPASRRS
jgi:menaquinone-specific isochorismate synthase